MEDPRQLILADQNLRDIRPVMDSDIDFAVGINENSYEIRIRRDRWDKRFSYGNAFYIKNTESAELWEKEDCYGDRYDFNFWQNLAGNAG